MLRHELAILRQARTRPVLTTVDRLFLAAASRFLSSACSSAWEILRALCGALAVQQARGLADFDEIAVWISHVAANFRSPVDRRRHELRPFRLPLLIAGLDVGDSQIHEH